MIVIFIISISAFMIISTMTRTRSVPPPCEVLHLLPWDMLEELPFLRAPPLRWVRAMIMVMVVMKEVDDGICWRGSSSYWCPAPPLANGGGGSDDLFCGGVRFKCYTLHLSSTELNIQCVPKISCSQNFEDSAGRSNFWAKVAQSSPKWSKLAKNGSLPEWSK